MKYEFSPSWSFNQMLLVSVFVHLLLLAIILPWQEETPPPIEAVAWNVELINDPSGRVEQNKPKAIDEKGDQKQESQATVSKPVPEKPKSAANKLETPEKKINVEKKAPVIKPPQVKPDVPVEKPSPPKKVVVASKPAENLLKVPVIPELTIPKIPVRERLPDVPKIERSTRKIQSSKPQPRSLPTPKKMAGATKPNDYKEFDQIAKLDPSVRQKTASKPNKKLITNEDIETLNQLMGGSGKITRANIVPLPLDNPLDGFDKIAMRDNDSKTRPKLVTGKDATLIRDLEFDSLSRQKREVEKLPDTKLASNRLQQHSKQKQLDTIANTQPLNPEIESKPATSSNAYKSISNKLKSLKSSNVNVAVSIDVKPSKTDPEYKVLSVEKLSATELAHDNKKSRRTEIAPEFKSQVQKTETALMQETPTTEPPDFSQKPFVDNSTIKNSLLTPSKNKVLSNTPASSQNDKVAALVPPKKSGAPSKSSPSKADKKGAELLSLYLGFVREKVMSNWKKPLGPKDKKVVVSFELFPGGNVGKPYVESSSGNPQLDALAIRAIEDSKPFPKFPSELKKSNLNVSIHFKYVYLQD
ncbi:MAG: TonB family protein [Nitrospinales bacterium]